MGLLRTIYVIDISFSKKGKIKKLSLSLSCNSLILITQILNLTFCSDFFGRVENTCFEPQDWRCLKPALATFVKQTHHVES